MSTCKVSENVGAMLCVHLSLIIMARKGFRVGRRTRDQVERGEPRSEGFLDALVKNIGRIGSPKGDEMVAIVIAAYGSQYARREELCWTAMEMIADEAQAFLDRTEERKTT